jgi:hypothetical protein
MAEYASQSRPSRALSLWGHYGTELLCGSILAAIALGVHRHQGVLGYAVPITLLAFVVVTYLNMIKHDRRLCEQCVATMPLNAAEQARKLHRRFWMAHTGSERRFLIPYLIVLLGSNFAPGTIGRIFWAFMQLSMIYLIVSNTSHRRLQPWCPWCSDGGGGSEQNEDVTPPPLPSDDRQLI